MAVATTEITGLLLDPSANVCSEGVVLFELSRPGVALDPATGKYESVADVVDARVTAAGLMARDGTTPLRLVPNAEIVPSGTYYAVRVLARPPGADELGEGGVDDPGRQLRLRGELLRRPRRQVEEPEDDAGEGREGGGHLPRMPRRRPSGPTNGASRRTGFAAGAFFGSPRRKGRGIEGGAPRPPGASTQLRRGSQAGSHCTGLVVLRRPGR